MWRMQDIVPEVGNSDASKGGHRVEQLSLEYTEDIACTHLARNRGAVERGATGQYALGPQRQSLRDIAAAANAAVD